MPRSTARSCVPMLITTTMAVDELRAALGVVADEVEWSACGSGGGVDAVGAVLQKLAQEGLGMVADAGGLGASDLGGREGAADGIGGEVVEAIVFSGCAVPVADVGLVPHFPEPVGGLAAVAIAQVGGVGEDQLRPLSFVLGRVGPAGKDVALGEGVAVGLGMSGKGLRHETDFDQRTHTSGDESIEDAVGDGEIVDGRAVGAFGVDVG